MIKKILFVVLLLSSLLFVSCNPAPSTVIINQAGSSSSSLWANNSGVATYEGDININGTNIHTEQIIVNSSGGYVTLDGVNDYVDFGNLPVSNWDEISVAGWMRLRDFSETVLGISIKHSGQDDIRLFYNSVDGLAWTLDDGSTDLLYSPFGASDYNTWVYMTGTFDGTNQKIYINGVEVASTTDNYNFAGSNGDFQLGTRVDSDDYWWNGDWDELMIFNRSINSSEISNLYSNGRNNGCYTSEGLYNHYTFDYNASDCKNNNDGLLSNGAFIEEYVPSSTTTGLEIKRNDGNYTTIKASDFITASRVPDTDYSRYQNNINNLPNWRNPHTNAINYEEHYAYKETLNDDGSVEKGLSMETRIETLEAVVYAQQQQIIWLMNNARMKPSALVTNEWGFD